MAEVKGRLAMADVIAAAVADRQAVPDAPVEITVDGTPLRFTADRRRPGPHPRPGRLAAAQRGPPGRSPAG